MGVTIYFVENIKIKHPSGSNKETILSSIDQKGATHVPNAAANEEGPCSCRDQSKHLFCLLLVSWLQRILRLFLFILDCRPSFLLLEPTRKLLWCSPCSRVLTTAMLMVIHHECSIEYPPLKGLILHLLSSLFLFWFL